jgi:protein gp37
MANQTKGGISWTDQTWNPIRGCSRVSQGCVNCYAEAVANRFSAPGAPYEGLVDAHGRWNGVIRVVEDHMLDPIAWGSPRRIFVNSMSDLFHENVPEAVIVDIFAVMALTPRHQYQILTKRPERMAQWFSGPAFAATQSAAKRIVEGWMDKHPKNWARFMVNAPVRVTLAGMSMKIHTHFTWPLDNVWLGISCEDQETADERIPKLMQSSAKVHWISAEPLIAPIDLVPFLKCNCRLSDSFNAPPWSHAPLCPCRCRLDWVVVGGESGPNARPMDLQWARDMKAACTHYGVAYHFKQTGGRHTHNDVPIPEDLDIREYPAEGR